MADFRHSNVCALAALVLLAAASAGRAATVWDESVNGNLSSNGAAPTPITLATGTNSVIGTVGTGRTQGWLTFDVPAGDALTSVVLAAYNSTDVQGFTGVQAGTSFVGSTTTAASYLGYTHFGTGAKNGALPVTNLVGSDFLGLMGDTTLAAGAQGFTPPLPAGNYVFLIQQLGASTNYQFDFVVSSIPEPAAAALLAPGLAVCLRRRRHRVRHYSGAGGE